MSGRTSGIVFEQECPLVAPVATIDKSKYHHVCTDTNITWEKVGKIYVPVFNGTNSSINAGNSNVLDFTYHNFTLIVWAKLFSGLAGNAQLFSRHAWNVSGWRLGYSRDTGNLTFVTFQAAVNQVTTAAAKVTFDTWCMYSVSRAGNSARIYRNDEDVVTSAGVHVDPVSDPTRTLYLGSGTVALEISYRLLGGIRILSRYLDASDIKGIFDDERTLFGI